MFGKKRIINSDCYSFDARRTKCPRYNLISPLIKEFSKKRKKDSIPFIYSPGILENICYQIKLLPLPY